MNARLLQRMSARRCARVGGPVAGLCLALASCQPRAVGNASASTASSPSAKRDAHPLPVVSIAAAPSARDSAPPPPREPTPDAGPDLSGACKDKLDRWVAEAADTKRTSLTVRTCLAPCRRVIRAESYSNPSSAMPKTLSLAQSTANEIGVQIVEWVPQDDNTIKYVTECREE